MTKRIAVLLVLALIVALGAIGHSYPPRASAAGPTFSGLSSVAFTYSGTAPTSTPTVVITAVTGQHIYLSTLMVSNVQAGPIAIYDGTTLIFSGDLPATTIFTLPHDWFFSGSGGQPGPGPNGYALTGSLGVISAGGGACYVSGTAANN